MRSVIGSEETSFCPRHLTLTCVLTASVLRVILAVLTKPFWASEYSFHVSASATRPPSENFEGKEKSLWDIFFHSTFFLTPSSSPSSPGLTSTTLPSSEVMITKDSSVGGLLGEDEQATAKWGSSSDPMVTLEGPWSWTRPGGSGNGETELKPYPYLPGGGGETPL